MSVKRIDVSAIARPSRRHPRRDNSLAFGLVAIVFMTLGLSLTGGEKDAAAESRARIVTADGSMLHCMLDHSAPWTFTSAGGAQVLKTELIESIDLAERIDPNVENAALVAVGDLQNDAFEMREKAALKLRSLGRAAAKPLKQALTSPDAEVVKRAKALLAEIGALDDEGFSEDRVHLRDGTLLCGTLALSDVGARSHFGRLRFPIEALARVVFEAAKKPDDPAFASVDSKEIAVPLPVAGPVESAAVQRWNPDEDAANDPGAMDGWFAEAQRNAVTMDKIRKPKAVPADAKQNIDTKPGDRLEDAYVERGVKFRATEAGVNVEASGETIQSFSGGRSLQVKKSDLEIRFVLPNSKDSAPVGVLHVGAVVRTAGPGTVGIATYDAAGRLLAQRINTPQELAPNAARSKDEFIGLRSSTPIARVRIYRVGALKESGGDVLLDDLVFDRIASAGLRGDQSRFIMINGDVLIGKTVEWKGDGVAFKVDFLGAESEPLKLKLSEIACYEPEHEKLAAKDPAADKNAKDDKPKTRRFGLVHGVLLQSGEVFRAHLIGINEKFAVFGLSRGAVLQLPRETLRKIDLHPKPTELGESPEATALAKDEKPGVEFKTKPLFNNPAVPQPKEEKKDPANNPAQGLPRMDNAEIVSIDPATQELTVKDDDGEMTMNLVGIQALVFPPNQKAGALDEKHAWTLMLREGSRFDVDVLKISASDIWVNMAGGKLLLPAETVERIERK